MTDNDESRVPFLSDDVKEYSPPPTSFEGPRKEMSAKNVRNMFPIVVEQKMGKPKYNLLTFLHCAFKITSLILYLVANILGLSYVLTFVTITILLSADFWLVKNVSGRLLAGLRWWNVVDESSGNQMSWRYESWTFEDRQLANKAQIHIFWLALIIHEVVWILLSMVAFFSLKLNWLILAIFALALNSANLYGYLKCKFYSGQGNQDSSGFGWTGQPSNEESAFKFVFRKSKEFFSTNQRAGYAQGQAGFVETF